MRVICIILLSMQLFACVSWQTVRQEDLNQQAVNLRRLGNAVQGELWRGAPEDADLLALACQRDPSLCEPFAKNSLLVKAMNDNVILLLCDSEGKRAYIEDIACTPETDRRAWEEGKAPCEFTLDASAACGD